MLETLQTQETQHNGGALPSCPDATLRGSFGPSHGRVCWFGPAVALAADGRGH